MTSLLEALPEQSEDQRAEAFGALDGYSTDELMAPLTDFLVVNERPDLFVRCIELAEKKGLAVSLMGSRADGWFDRIGAEIPNMDTLCDIIGARFLAYSMILGVQIRGLSTDPRFPSSTTIDFAVGDDVVQTLSLVEYKIRLVQALLQKEQLPRLELQLPLLESNAAAFVGGKLILLAPLFDISLEMLIKVGDDAGGPRALIGYTHDNEFHLLNLEEFEASLYEEIGDEIETIAEGAFKLDLGLVEAAREAADDPEQVIGLMGSWPGILSLLQRTPLARTLDQAQREAIGDALDLLADAFGKCDREEMVEELIRLGLNFVREGEVAARLFVRLSRMLIADGRFAESIGLLRRSIALGAAEEEMLPLLGTAFLRSGKRVAGRALLEAAERKGWLPAQLKGELTEARRIFEEADVHWAAVE